LRSATAFALLVAVAVAQPARGQQPTFCTFAEPAPRQLTPYENAKTAIVSLWYARNAAQRGNDLQKELESVQDMTSFTAVMMRATKESTNDYICARRAVEPFTRASGHTQTVAQFFTQIYDAHINLNLRMIELVKNLPKISQAEFADRVSTLQVERRQLSSDLLRPTTLALMLLVDTKRTDDSNKTTRVVITRAQKQELFKWTRQQFPEFGNGTPESQWTGPAQTAHFVFNFFEGRKCSDE
jgi:hypothetical protein